MIKIAICDDNELHRDHVKNLAIKAMHRHETEFACFENAEALIAELQTHTFVPDIAILDINMDGMDGISLARQLNEHVPACKIIFLSAYLSYAQDVYNVEHVWFVLKHDVEQRLEVALNKAISLIKQERGTGTALLKTTEGVKLVQLSEILYIERSGLKTNIVTADSVLVSNKAPNSVIAELSEENFIRSTQSRWLNKCHIAKLEHDEFVLSNGLRSPLSRTYKKLAKEQFFSAL